MNIQKEKDLTFATTMKTKCVAEEYVEVNTREELLEAIQYAAKDSKPLLILGGGSNTIIVKNRIDGLVVKNRYSEKEVVAQHDNDVEIRVSSGYIVNRLVMETASAGYQGIEYHMGLPGTVGGAIYMNSKWTRPVNYFGDCVVSATLVDREGNVKTVDRDYFQFAYDFSILQKTGEYLIDVTFRFSKASPDELKKRTKEALEYRNQTQPVSRATSGCFFQNIGEDEQKRLGVPTASAGYLIDQTGLKGMHVGSFTVSEKHANFIIDEAEGNPADLKKLMDIVKARVKEKYSIELKEEIRVIN